SGCSHPVASTAQVSVGDVMRTRILAIVLIAISGFIYWGTMDLVVSPFEPLGSAAVPRVIAAVVALLSLGLLFFPGAGKAVVSDFGPEDTDEDAPPATPIMAWATAACALLFAFVLQSRLVSFGLAAAVSLVVLMSILT